MIPIFWYQSSHNLIYLGFKSNISWECLLISNTVLIKQWTNYKMYMYIVRWTTLSSQAILNGPRPLSKHRLTNRCDHRLNPGVPLPPRPIGLPNMVLLLPQTIGSHQHQTHGVELHYLPGSKHVLVLDDHDVSSGRDRASSPHG